MKKVVLFALCLAVCCFMFACSKKSGGSSKTTGTVKIYYDFDDDFIEIKKMSSLKYEYNKGDEPVEVASWMMPMYLLAVLYDKDGNVVEDYTTAWTCNSNAVAFSDPKEAGTVLFFKDDSIEKKQIPTEELSLQITADCNGVKCSMPITIYAPIYLERIPIKKNQ